jgi:hypothetical protein
MPDIMDPVENFMITVSLIGLGLIFSVCRRLSVAHPAKYDELGGLAPIFRTARGAARFFKFLFSGEVRALADTALIVQVVILRVVFVVSTIVAVWLFVSFLLANAA